MKLSVIVPSFNQGKFLRACIDSILNQEELNTEVIVFDGGSTDNSVEVLKSYGDKIFWVSKKDRGQTDAINKGLRIATGDILAYLNSDDMYYPGCAERIIRHFTDNPDSIAAYGKSNHVHENGDIMEPYYCEPWDYDKLLYVCYICQPGTFWRREAMERFGVFDDTLNYCMDYEYWLRIGKHRPFHYIDDQVLAASRLHEDTKTLSQKVPVHTEICRVLTNYSINAGFHWLKHAAHIHGEQEDGDLDDSENYMRKYHFNLVRDILDFGDKMGFPFKPCHLNELEQKLSS